MRGIQFTDRNQLMKQLSSTGLKGRFDRASRAIEERFADRPVWFKLLLFVPVLILLTAMFMLVVYGFGFGLLALSRLIAHH